jgi:hypothetical protein
MPKQLARKVALWHFGNPKSFPENQQQMEHSDLLMFPDYLNAVISHFKMI